MERRSELSNHPLRIWKPASPPPDLPSEEIERFRVLAAIQPIMIGFNFQDRTAFIEPLPNYREVISILEEQKKRWAITSVMVGHILDNSTAYEDVRAWFPFYLFPVLELLAGRELGSPWIEWRDSEGRLTGRTHIHVRCPPFEKGQAAFRAGSAGYAGLLLTEAQSSPHVREPWLSGVVRNLLRSTVTDLIELRAAFVFLAIDSMCERFGFSTQDLSASLDSVTRDQVREILQDSASRLRSLAAAHPDPDSARVLRQIADRSSGMDQKDRAFGSAAVNLLQHFGFEHDIRIASANYAENATGQQRSWEAALSHWRGVTLHGWYFDFDSGQYDFELILSTCYHLHDLALRIVLLSLGFTGEYQPAVCISDNRKPIDWVTAKSTARNLGYERGYRLR